ncbi:hypothetical protein KC316_g10 [Hortaea werneckii]|nr:hypothetical protein KC316_g10 [Hortaea werneckii]
MQQPARKKHALQSRTRKKDKPLLGEERGIILGGRRGRRREKENKKKKKKKKKKKQNLGISRSSYVVGSGKRRAYACCAFGPSSRRCRYCCRCRFFRHTNASVSLVGELGKVIPFIFSTVSFEKEEYQSAGETAGRWVSFVWV